MAVTLIGGLASFGWGLALGFALGITFVTSMLVLAATPEEALELRLGPVQRRMFKGEGAATSLTVGRGSGRDLAKVELDAVPDGLDATLTGEGPTRALRVTSEFAGVFKGIRVKVGILDPLKLFARIETHQLDIAFEFLPTYLLAKREPMRVSAAMLGDYPAGRGGLGQEFYSAETYTPASPSRDIMWKLQAKMPNDDLMVRVGEANIPERLTVCFIQGGEFEGRRSPRWMDLTSEAMARVGLPVVATGTKLRLLCVLGGKWTVAEARDRTGLANLIMGLWRDDVVKENSDAEPVEADLIVTTESETQVPATHKLLVDKPSVILKRGSKKVPSASNVVFFTGLEDVSWLIARVLSR